MKKALLLSGATLAILLVGLAAWLLRSPDDMIFLRRSEYKDIALTSILQMARATPDYTKDGSLRGFKLLEIKEDSLFDDARLQNGDVILSINGQALTTFEQTMKISSSLDFSWPVVVEIERDGKVIEHRYVLQDD